MAIPQMMAPSTKRMKAAAQGLPSSAPSLEFHAAMMGMPTPVANMRSESSEVLAGVVITSSVVAKSHMKIRQPTVSHDGNHFDGDRRIVMDLPWPRVSCLFFMLVGGVPCHYQTCW